MKSAASSVSSAADQAVEVKGVKVLAQRVGALDRGQLRTLVDNLRNKLGSGVVVLGSVQEDGKVAIIVGVTKDLTAKLQAGKIIAPSCQTRRRLRRRPPRHGRSRRQRRRPTRRRISQRAGSGHVIARLSSSHHGLKYPRSAGVSASSRTPVWVWVPLRN